MLHSNLSVNGEGHLLLAGMDTVALAAEYGTPLYLLDEDRIRSNCRTYLRTMRECFTPGSAPLFASKALCFKEMYRIAAQEGMRTDLVSPGELYTAQCADFPLANAYFHGNNKTDADIDYAVRAGVGHFVVDNAEELAEVDRVAARAGIRQRVFLRLTPGIDPHTHAAITTGKVDSKFGTAIETGQADLIVEKTLRLPHVELEGFHCHIGSQIFEVQPFCDAADIMLSYCAHVREKWGYTVSTLNLGGGFGVRYVEAHPAISVEANLRMLAAHIRTRCEELQFPVPAILMEPGRSIVADAGVTLYTVGSVKTITGYKSYVSVDGGMADNPRYALYQSDYTCLIANKADRPADFVCTVAGRCCESGDLLQENVALAKPVRGDLLAVLVTGAYNYSMASNYNRLPRPPVVMLRGGEARIAVRRETYADLLRLDQ